MLKKYFMVAIALSMLTAIWEEVQNPTSSWNQQARGFLSQHSSGEFLISSSEKPAKKRKGAKTNEEEEGNDNELKLYAKGETLDLKGFSTQLIRSYRPGVFIGLADDWPMTQKFADLKEQAMTESDQPIPNYLKYFGFELHDKVIEIYEYSSLTYDRLLDSTSKVYSTLTEFILLACKLEEPNTKYYVRGERQDRKAYVLEDWPLMEDFMDEVKEPEVTKQLLDLQNVTFSMHGRDAKETAHTDHTDRMTCLVSGNQTWYVVPAMERVSLALGKPFPGHGQILPKTHSPVFFPKPDPEHYQTIERTTFHVMNLVAGDCVYMPAYWWHMSVTTPQEPAVSVTFWYDISSDWLTLFMKGVENDEL